MKNIIVEYINRSDSLNLNYEDVDNKITLNFGSKKSVPCAQIRHKIIYITLLFFVFIAATFSIILIYQKNKAINTYVVYLNEKSERFINFEFSNDDVFFAFGPLDNKYETVINTKYHKPSQVHVCSKDFIAKTIFISDEDKAILMEYESGFDKEIYPLSTPFNIYLGERNGKDVIVLSVGETPIFMFYSILEYSFIDVIEKFELMINEKLDKEVLCGKNTGIFVDFENVDNLYVPFYVLEYNHKIYTIKMND